jgi:putative ABC transport system substrate-binding protein
MNQRRFLMLAVAAGFAGQMAPLRAQTSSASLRRVGVLVPSTPAKEEVILKPFFDQMRQLGWIEGQNIVYDRVYADDQQQDLPRLAAELVARKPELVYAPPPPAAVAAKQATQTIPIVFGQVFDPVGIGLVASLARPGGNVTGMSASTTEPLALKRIELLREILPGVKHIGLIGDSTDPSSKVVQQALAPLAAQLGLTFIYAEVATPVEFETLVAKLVAGRTDAIMVAGVAPIVGNLFGRLLERANEKRIPVIAGAGIYADAGALFSYGAPRSESLRRSALLVDKILKGAKPADLPVEQPTLFELVVNLKAAKALGIKIPQSILLRADRVIE